MRTDVRSPFVAAMSLRKLAAPKVFPSAGKGPPGKSDPSPGAARGILQGSIANSLPEKRKDREKIRATSAALELVFSSLVQVVKLIFSEITQ